MAYLFSVHATLPQATGDFVGQQFTRDPQGIRLVEV